MVYKSWLGSYKAHALDVPYTMYAKLYQHLLDRIILRSECQVVLAVDPADPDFIFGFAVLERSVPVLHYIYTKHKMRKNGIGSELLAFVQPDGAEFKYTFQTTFGRNFLGKRGGKFSRTFTRGELP